jgi:uncharacterized ParB-like nuclease family protein
MACSEHVGLANFECCRLDSDGVDDASSLDMPNLPTPTSPLADLESLAGKMDGRKGKRGTKKCDVTSSDVPVGRRGRKKKLIYGLSF